MKINGIHHISSVVGNPQKDVDFYASLLALRMVKKTLNYEDKSMYHFFYGNHDASTGLITTFPMEFTQQGIVGNRQTGTASLGIRKESFDFWKERLESFAIETTEIERFGRRRLLFDDPDGLELELIETEKGIQNTWEFNGVDKNNAIIGLDSAVLYSNKATETLDLLTNTMSYELVDEDNSYYLLKVNDTFGGTLELAKNVPGRGIPGVGTVHHLAFKVEDKDIEKWKETLEAEGYHPTEIKDRGSFRSIYFHEKGGILFEFATEKPGMKIDSMKKDLGEKLEIPKHFKGEELPSLPPIAVREINNI
ncbi:MAG: VOC family protein [Atopostipes suicloacalis]|nr:VOC family protein [Atopostipes suicloacalis]